MWSLSSRDTHTRTLCRNSFRINFVRKRAIIDRLSVANNLRTMRKRDKMSKKQARIGCAVRLAGATLWLWCVCVVVCMCVLSTSVQPFRLARFPARSYGQSRAHTSGCHLQMRARAQNSTLPICGKNKYGSKCVVESSIKCTHSDVVREYNKGCGQHTNKCPTFN